ncbi:MAG: glycosyl hydrolase, partial [Burkholderiales bacterium]
LSRDSGERFSAVASGIDGLAAYFELDGRRLWYGAFDGQPVLAHAALEGGDSVRVPLPPLARDAVAYIAQNPARRDELAIATFRRNVYLSPDRGRTWRRIAAEGEAR